MNEVLTALVMGEISNNDIFIKELTERTIAFISKEQLNNAEDIYLKIYRLEDSTYECLKLENCKLSIVSKEKTHFVYHGSFTNVSEEFLKALLHLEEFKSEFTKIRKGDYSGLNYLNSKKEMYPSEQDNNIQNNINSVIEEWFDFKNIVEAEHEKFSIIASKKEIAFALNTYDLMQKCKTDSYSNIFKETIKKYNLENHGLFKNGIQRVYIGNEFCQYLFPYTTILNYIQKAVEEGYEITVMMSFMSENMSDKILKSIDDIENFCTHHNMSIEIVVNDWGILNYINKSTSRIIPILGRLLNKRKKDPRKKWIWRNHNDETVQYNCISNNNYFRKLVNSYGMERYEFEVYDNHFEEEGTNLKGQKNSLHFPFYQMMTSLHCPLLYEYNTFNQNKLDVNTCPHICREIIRLYSKDLRMIGIGNSNYIFVKDELTNSELLENYCNNGVDRLVFSPFI